MGKLILVVIQLRSLLRPCQVAQRSILDEEILNQIVGGKNGYETYSLIRYGHYGKRRSLGVKPKIRRTVARLLRSENRRSRVRRIDKSYEAFKNAKLAQSATVL